MTLDVESVFLVSFLGNPYIESPDEQGLHMFKDHQAGAIRLFVARRDANNYREVLGTYVHGSLIVNEVKSKDFINDFNKLNRFSMVKFGCPLSVKMCTNNIMEWPIVTKVVV